MSDAIQFHTAASPAELAEDLAEFVAQVLRESLQRRGEALLIVSGGSTPVPFFEALSKKSKDDVDWSRVHVTLADERWVPPDHADSNGRLVQAHLLQGDAAKARWLPLYDGASTPKAGQRDMEAKLAALPWPADVVVLGMGGDGHTASLFPHAPELTAAFAEGAQVPRCMSVTAPSLPNVPVPRLTLTRHALLDARQVVAHVTGEAKLKLLHAAIQPGPMTQWPIRLALHQDEVPCHVFHAN